MTTTTSRAAPQFRIRSRHAALGGLAVAALCAVLAGTFIAEVWHGPASAPRNVAAVRA